MSCLCQSETVLELVGTAVMSSARPADMDRAKAAVLITVTAANKPEFFHLFLLLDSEVIR
jgi:hypothetical protein